MECVSTHAARPRLSQYIIARAMLWRHDREKRTTKHTESKSLLGGVCPVAQNVVLPKSPDVIS
jgi:hypothetical protein